MEQHYIIIRIQKQKKCYLRLFTVKGFFIPEGNKETKITIFFIYSHFIHINYCTAIYGIMKRIHFFLNDDFFFLMQYDVKGHLSVSPWVHRSEGLWLFSPGWSDLPPRTHPAREIITFDVFLFFFPVIAMFLSSYSANLPQDPLHIFVLF